MLGWLRSSAMLRAMTGADSPLTAWLRTPLGRRIRALEQPIVAAALNRVFGLQMLQIGPWGHYPEWLDSGPTRRQTLLWNSPGQEVNIISRSDAVAVATASVDVVVVPHTLELEEKPHDLLREVDRVLVGEGHLLILGFSPNGLWGLRRIFSGGRFPPGTRRFITQRRLRDWLALLGFEVLSTEQYCYVPPVNNKTIVCRSSGIEKTGQKIGRFGGAYLMLAQKHVYTMTPVRPRRQKKRQMVTGIVEPTTRSSQ